MSEFLSLALGVPSVLAAAGWPLGPLLFVLPAPVGPFVAVPVGVAAPAPVVHVVLPYPSPCLCSVLGLWFVLPFDVLQMMRQLLLLEALAEQIPVKEIPSQPFSIDAF